MPIIKPGMWAPGLRRQDPQARGLVALYPMWEGAGSQVQDVVDGGGRLNGTGASGLWVVGNRGPELNFNEATPDRVAAGTELNVGDLTIAAWVRPNQPSGSGYVISKNLDSNSQFSYALLANATGPRWHVLLSSDGTSLTNMAGPNTYVDNVWQHVAITYQTGIGTTWYQNGQFAGFDATFTGSIFQGAGRVTIGARWDSSAVEYRFGIRGGIESVAVYTRVLIPFEIKDLFNNPNRLITPEPLQLGDVGVAGFIPYPHPLLNNMTGGMAV